MNIHMLAKELQRLGVSVLRVEDEEDTTDASITLTSKVGVSVHTFGGGASVVRECNDESFIFSEVVNAPTGSPGQLAAMLLPKIESALKDEIKDDEESRRLYEIKVKGYYGGTDKTDSEIVWVSSPQNIDRIREELTTLGVNGLVVSVDVMDMAHDLDLPGLDFVLPKDYEQLASQIRELASDKVAEFSCFVNVTGEASNPDDEEIPGVYQVEVTLEQPVALADLTEAQHSMIASAVLDEFHENNGIEVLDDFGIDVFLQDGTQISDDDLKADNFEVSADYLGSVDALPFSTPAAKSSGLSM